MITVSDNIKSISPYVPGNPIEELERELGISGSIKLASNENPLGPSPKAIAAVKKVVEGLNRYPDGSGFYLSQALAKKYGVDIAQIILGNGSNELIELVVRTFVQPGDEIISADPSFVVYKMITQAACGANVIVPCKDMRHDLDAMAERITPKTKIVFIANPNNPTGTMNTKAEMDRFMDRVPDHVIVAVDEAYFEYVTHADYPDSLDYLKEGKNILALRTFSKIYGLAGLRIGYGITTRGDRRAHEQGATALQYQLAGADRRAGGACRTGSTWRSRSPSTTRGSSSCTSPSSGSASRTSRRRRTSSCSRPPWTARTCTPRCSRQGVIIRPMGGKRLRVTIGLPEENKRFVAELEKIVKA